MEIIITKDILLVVADLIAAYDTCLKAKGVEEMTRASLLQQLQLVLIEQVALTRVPQNGSVN